MKKIIYIFVLSFLLCSLSSCRLTHLEDIIPNETDYSIWDGNYIYFANYKCKTDGSSEEVLFNNITYNDNVYEVSNVIDYVFGDKDIYYIILSDNIGLFVKYSITNKSIELIYKSKLKYNSQIHIYGDELVVNMDSNLVKYNMNSKKIDTLENINYITFDNEHIVYILDNTTYLTTWNNDRKEFIEHYQKGSYEFFFVDDYKLVKIINYNNLNDKNKTIIHELKLYDISSKEMHRIIEFNEEKFLISHHLKYMVIGNRKYYGKKDKGYVEENNIINNVLYKFQYNNGLKWDKVKLKTKRQYVILDVVDNVIKFEESYFKTFPPTLYPTSKKNIKYYNIDSNKLTKDTNVVFEIENDNYLEYKDIYYTIKTYDVGPLLGRKIAGLLYRVDNENEELMQFFVDSDYDDLYVDHCSKYFRQWYIEETYPIFNSRYFKILNY